MSAAPAAPSSTAYSNAREAPAKERYRDFDRIWGRFSRGFKVYTTARGGVWHALLNTPADRVLTGA